MADDYMEPSYLEWLIMRYLRQGKASYENIVINIYRVPMHRLFREETISLTQALIDLQQRRWIVRDVIKDLYCVVGQE